MSHDNRHTMDWAAVILPPEVGRFDVDKMELEKVDANQRERMNHEEYTEEEREVNTPFLGFLTRP